MKNLIIILLTIAMLTSSVSAYYDCGDGNCASGYGETASNCPADCTMNCGDNNCVPGEHAANCPQDCNPECGNSVVEPGEQCDDGSQNSELTADACRTNCVLHHCGDGTADSDEECDSYYLGDAPNQCREDCTMPYCGDGIVDDEYLDGDVNRQSGIDDMFNEECDDGNNDDNDGCTNDCKACLPVHDDLLIIEDPGLPLCAGEYSLPDAGEPGIIQVQGFNWDLDCNGAVLIGVGANLMTDTMTPSIPGGTIPPVVGEGADPAVSRPNTNAEPEDTNTGTPPDVGDQYTLKRGIGIIVKGNSILLKNCDVRNFNKGIKFENGGNVLFQSKSCGNTVDVVSTGHGNFGVLNECDRATNWFERGNTCKTGCDGELNTPVPVEDCPTCECQEELLEEDEEEQEDEEGGFFSKIFGFFLGKDKEEKMTQPLVAEKEDGKSESGTENLEAKDESPKSEKKVDMTIDTGDNEEDDEDTSSETVAPVKTKSRYAAATTTTTRDTSDDDTEEEDDKETVTTVKATTPTIKTTTTVRTAPEPEEEETPVANITPIIPVVQKIPVPTVRAPSSR